MYDAKEAEQHRLILDCACTNQRGEVVISGSAKVIAPTEKVKRPRAILPEVLVHDHGAWYRHLLDLMIFLEANKDCVRIVIICLSVVISL
jgi:hypothetical protein